MKNDNLSQRIEQRLQERKRKEEQMQKWEQSAKRSFRLRPLYITLAAAAAGLTLVFVLSPFMQPTTTSRPTVPAASETEIFRGADASLQQLVDEGSYDMALHHVDSLIEIQDRMIRGLEFMGDLSEEDEYEIEAYKQKRDDLKTMRKKIKKSMRK